MNRTTTLLFALCLYVLPAKASGEIGDSLVKKLSAVKAPKERAELYEAITRYYLRRSFDSYSDYLEKAYKELESNPDSALSIRGAIYHARYLVLKGQVGDGIDLLGAKAEQAKRLGLTKEEHLARKSLMGTLRSIGDVNLLLNQISILQKDIDKSSPEAWAEVWFFEGTAYLMMEQWDQALDAYMHALEVKGSFSQSLLGDIYQGIGMSYRGKGFFKKGLDYYLLAQKEFESVGDIYGLFFVKTEMAADYGNLGALYQAKRITQEAEQMALAYHNERMLITTSYLLSGFAAELKQFDEARVTLAKLKSLAQKHQPDTLFMGYYYLSYSTLLTSMGKYDSAFVIILRARNLYKQKQFPYYEHKAYIQIFSIYAQIFHDGDTLNDLKYVNAPTPLGYPDLVSMCKGEIDKLMHDDLITSELYQLHGVLVDAYKAQGKYEAAEEEMVVYDSLKNLYFNFAYLYIKDAREQEFRLVLQEKDFQMAAQEDKITFQNQIIARDTKIKLLSWIALLVAVVFSLILFFILSRLRKYSHNLDKANQELLAYQNQLLSQKEAIEAQNKIIREQKDMIQAQLERKDRELASQLLIMQQYSTHIHETQKSIRSIYSQAHNPAVSESLKEVVTSLNELSTADYGWETFRLQFEEVHTNFFSELLRLHPDLTSTDLKHCALIHLGLSNKEKAQLMNLTYKGIDSANYRIKKKLNLDPEENLANYLMKIGL